MRALALFWARCGAWLVVPTGSACLLGTLCGKAPPLLAAPPELWEGCLLPVDFPWAGFLSSGRGAWREQRSLELVLSSTRIRGTSPGVIRHRQDMQVRERSGASGGGNPGSMGRGRCKGAGVGHREPGVVPVASSADDNVQPRTKSLVCDGAGASAQATVVTCSGKLGKQDVTQLKTCSK